MPLPARCDNCSWWKFSYPDGILQLGICSNPNITDNVRIASTEDDYDHDETTIFTASSFGCNEHEIFGNRAVTDIDL